MIHRYKNNGYNIVLDVNSGSVHVVDDIVYDIVGCLEEKMSEEAILEKFKNQYKEEDIRTAIEECRELEEAQMLFTNDIYENAIESFKDRPTVVKALCLHIAHDCNLACRYCFAEEGEYHGRRALMTYEVGKQALDFLIANSGNRKNLEVDFFGGEPLMNWNVVKELVAYGIKKWTTLCLVLTEEKKFMISCVRSVREKEVMIWLFRNSRSLQTAEGSRNIMQGEHLPIIIWIFQKTYCIWLTLVLNRFR